jgi:CheY-like chemotaxis protein/two-component sensor histidine kinase
MLGWLHLLREGRLTPEQEKRALETVERSARAQHKLIEDLLDLSRVITGKLRLEVREVALAPVVEAAVESARPAAEARGVALLLDLDPQVGRVLGDPDRLQQIVWNLVSNAVKFTPEGGRVEVRLARAGGHAEIAVSDTGEGIAPDFLPHVFERFRQQDSSTTRRHGGLGLGLAIVRHLVELHGGRVRAESAGPGQGATFTVRLPLMQVRDSELGVRGSGSEGQNSEPLTPNPELAGVRVLVVDDQPDSLDFACAVLTQAGAEVKLASGAGEALDLFEGWVPDVVVCDIGMPGEDGYELMRKVRAREAERGGRVPALALTAYARAQDDERARAAGFQLHLAKPVEPPRLLAAVKSLAAGNLS